MNCKKNVEYARLSLISLVTIMGLFFCISNSFSQNTSIVFNTKKNSTIGISKEIDNTFTSTLTDEINTDTEGNYTYSWDVNGFQFVQCHFHDGGTIFFPITEGSHLTITYKGDHKFEFGGAEKTEVEYYINDYKDIIRPFVGSLFSLPAESTFDDLSLLIAKYDSVLSNSLDSLTRKKIISPKFSNILKNEFNTLIASIGIGTYRSIYLESGQTKVNEQDSIKVESIINGILNKISPMVNSGDILKYNLGSNNLAVYYTTKYSHLDEKDKEKLLSKYIWYNQLTPNKLGYLIAPKEIQYKLLSLELLENYANAVIRGDSAIFDYISEIRPQNAFLPYLKEKRHELLLTMNTDISGVKYIEDTINTLEDLNRVNDFNQKMLYIDLWATWCAPCIAESKHRNKVHELLSNYENIITVYISIDEDKNDAIWKEKTTAFNLNGYHLRANKNLVKDIQKKIYDGKIMGVPNYILLGKDGTVLERNLPRPSNIDKLKQELDKYFD